MIHSILFVLSEVTFYFTSYMSYLPLAHIYERANQIVVAYFGGAVGFYQGVCEIIPIHLQYLDTVNMCSCLKSFLSFFLQCKFIDAKLQMQHKYVSLGSICCPSCSAYIYVWAILTRKFSIVFWLIFLFFLYINFYTRTGLLSLAMLSERTAIKFFQCVSVIWFNFVFHSYM